MPDVHDLRRSRAGRSPSTARVGSGASSSTSRTGSRACLTVLRARRARATSTTSATARAGERSSSLGGSARWRAPTSRSIDVRRRPARARLPLRRRRANGCASCGWAPQVSFDDGPRAHGRVVPRAPRRGCVRARVPIVTAPRAAGPSVKLVVTGAGGGLGRAFLAQVPSHHEVHAFTHAELDVGDHDAVRCGRSSRCGPTPSCNLAAFTQVDANETDPARASRDNAIGPQNLALAARACGAVAPARLDRLRLRRRRRGRPTTRLDVPRPLSVVRAGEAGGGARSCATWCRSTSSCASGYVYGGGATTSTRRARAARRGGVGRRHRRPDRLAHLRRSPRGAAAAAAAHRTLRHVPPGGSRAGLAGSTS